MIASYGHITTYGVLLYTIDTGLSMDFFIYKGPFSGYFSLFSHLHISPLPRLPSEADFLCNLDPKDAKARPLIQGAGTF